MLLPVVATLGISVWGAMIYGLGWTNWIRLFVWLIIGLVVYFFHGTRRSKLAQPSASNSAPSPVK
jgi:APA family basic amino acid/polyamine antiporter